jgi:hypothetical protein
MPLLRSLIPSTIAFYKHGAPLELAFAGHRCFLHVALKTILPGVRHVPMTERLFREEGHCRNALGTEFFSSAIFSS